MACSGSTDAVLWRGSHDGQAVAWTVIEAVASGASTPPVQVTVGAKNEHEKPLSAVAELKLIPDGRLSRARTPDAGTVGQLLPVARRLWTLSKYETVVPAGTGVG